MQPDCQLSAVLFDQLDAFVSIANAIAASPQMLLCIMSYRIPKNHVVAQLNSRFAERDRDIFSVFEAGSFRTQLVNAVALNQDLVILFETFQNLYGDKFHQAEKKARRVKLPGL